MVRAELKALRIKHLQNYLRTAGAVLATAMAGTSMHAQVYPFFNGQTNFTPISSAEDLILSIDSGTATQYGGVLAAGQLAINPFTANRGTLRIASSAVAGTEFILEYGKVEVLGNGVLSTNASGAKLWVGANAGTSAELVISNGGRVSNDTGLVGGNPTSSGAVTVTGTQSTWTNTGELYIGNAGTGSLTISNGGEVTTGEETFLGYSPSGSGAMTVTGTGSLLETQSLGVGYSGSGTMTISNGGKVTTQLNSVGYAPGGNGTLTVQGAGSTLAMTSVSEVGGFGKGAMVISNGGTATSTSQFSSVPRPPVRDPSPCKGLAPRYGSMTKS